MCEAKGVVVSEQFLPEIQKCRKSGECPSLESVILIDKKEDGGWGFHEMIQKGQNAGGIGTQPLVDTTQDVSLLLYSSGTTGKVPSRLSHA